MLAGEQSVRFSATSAVAGYWAPAKPQRRPGFFDTRNSGSARLRCGLSRRFRRRSEITPTCVAAIAGRSLAKATCRPVKLAALITSPPPTMRALAFGELALGPDT